MMECPPEIQGACPLKRHVLNTHHKYWPAYEYASSLERQFRELPENKEVICTFVHNMIHLEEPTPDKPSREIMLEAIYRPRE